MPEFPNNWILLVNSSNSMEAKNLYTLAGGLNIEGGYPYIDLLKTNSKGKWVNLIVVLDRPLIDKIIFDDIFINNKYQLLESAVDNLNEHHFLAAFLMIMCYYVENGRNLFSKTNNDIFRIMVHIHQDKKSQPLVCLLQEYFNKLVNLANLDTKNINIDYCTDDKYYVRGAHDYTGIDLLLSFSQCAGLDPELNPGSLLLPCKFIPYDIDTKTIKKSETYQMENILLFHLKNILGSRFNTLAVDVINNNYISSNHNKHFTASELLEKDFIYTNILQANKLWNPTDENEKMEIV